MDPQGDAVRDVSLDPFAAPPEGTSVPDPALERASVRGRVVPLAARRRRAVVWSLVCFVIGVPLMAFSASVLERGLTSGAALLGPGWIWFSVIAGPVAAAIVVAVLRGRWNLARNLALLLMLPGVLAGVGLIWAFGFGLFFLPSALVWLPVFIVCLRMPGQERAAAASPAAA